MVENSTNQIVTALFNTFNLLKNRLSYKSAFFQLPLAQMETLRLIAQNKRLLMKDVASYLAITPPSATVLIGHLAKSGFVKRHPDKKDRRIVHLTLTKKGLAVMNKGVKERCKNLKKMVGNLSRNEQFTLLNNLNKMVQ